MSFKDIIILVVDDEREHADGAAKRAMPRILLQSRTGRACACSRRPGRPIGKVLDPTGWPSRSHRLSSAGAEANRANPTSEPAGPVGGMA